MVSGSMDITPVRRQLDTITAQVKATEDTLNRVTVDVAAIRAGIPPASGAVGGVAGLAAMQSRIEDLASKVEALTKQITSSQSAAALSAASPAASSELSQRMASLESKFAAMSDAISKLAADRQSGKAGLEMLIMQQAALREQVTQMSTSPGAMAVAPASSTPPALSDAEQQRMRDFERELREMQEVVRTLRINTAVAPGVMPSSAAPAALPSPSPAASPQNVLPPGAPAPTDANLFVSTSTNTWTSSGITISNPAAPSAISTATTTRSASSQSSLQANTAPASVPTPAILPSPGNPAAIAASQIITTDASGNVMRVPASSLRSVQQAPAGSSIRPALDYLPVGVRDLRPRRSIVNGQPLTTGTSIASAIAPSAPVATNLPSSTFDPYDPSPQSLSPSESAWASASSSSTSSPAANANPATIHTLASSYTLQSTEATTPGSSVPSAEPLPASRIIKPTSVGLNWAQSHIGWLGWPFDAAGNLVILIGESLDAAFTGTEFVSQQEWEKMGGK
jgi:hypothetical protein